MRTLLTNAMLIDCVQPTPLEHASVSDKRRRSGAAADAGRAGA
jgi:hypothetical protein